MCTISLTLTYTAEKHGKIKNPNRSPSALIMLLSFCNVPFSRCKEENSIDWASITWNARIQNAPKSETFWALTHKCKILHLPSYDGLQSKCKCTKNTVENYLQVFQNLKKKKPDPKSETLPVPSTSDKFTKAVYPLFHYKQNFVLIIFSLP